MAGETNDQAMVVSPARLRRRARRLSGGRDTVIGVGSRDMSGLLNAG